MNTAADIMTRHPVTVSRDTSLSQAARLLLDGHFNGLPVVEDGKLVGMLTQSDLISLDQKLHTPGYFLLLGGVIPLQLPGSFAKELKRFAARTVGEIMSTKPQTIAPDTPVDDIATLMIRERFYTLPVVEDGRLIGIVGMEDLLKRLAEQE
ncbi:CBS domain-containing protein [uncultured Mailhella sp.]|uniref:CBS domain-containing protein n=1 Tax=uncultured Mailhella sp. TaxID=1981031 RepID=UPI002622BB45|nr:CBS domain-containing protein [uncultured Mailhella sp.]